MTIEWLIFWGLFFFVGLPLIVGGIIIMFLFLKIDWKSFFKKW